MGLTSSQHSSRARALISSCPYHSLLFPGLLFPGKGQKVEKHCNTLGRHSDVNHDL